MPNKLYVDRAILARRHVLSQQLYRLRSRYRLLMRSGLHGSALSIRSRISSKEREYDSLGGRPHHRGNVL